MNNVHIMCVGGFYTFSLGEFHTLAPKWANLSITKSQNSSCNFIKHFFVQCKNIEIINVSSFWWPFYILTCWHLTDVRNFDRVSVIIPFSLRRVILVIQCINFNIILIFFQIIRASWVPIWKWPCSPIRPNPGASGILITSSPYPAHRILIGCCHSSQYEFICGSIWYRNKVWRPAAKLFAAFRSIQPSLGGWEIF